MYKVGREIIKSGNCLCAHFGILTSKHFGEMWFIAFEMAALV